MKHLFKNAEAMASAVVTLAILALIVVLGAIIFAPDVVATVVNFIAIVTIGMTGLAFTAGLIWLASFGSDHALSTLCKVEKWRQERAITAQEWERALLIASEARVNDATAIASMTVVQPVTPAKDALIIRGEQVQRISKLPDADDKPLALQEPLPDLLQLLSSCQNILIIGKKGSGKSNLIRRLIDARLQANEICTVLDPHAAPDTWGNARLVGLGLDFEAIEAELQAEDFERVQRYRALGKGQQQFASRTLAIDEMTEITSEADVAQHIQKLLNCRKIAMSCIIGGHSPNAKDVGLDGRFNLVKNFDAHVRIQYDKATEERRFWICLNPMSHFDEFIEVANPGEYVPPVPRHGEGVPDPVPSPFPSVPVPQTERLRERYQGRDLEIALAIMRGWNKTKTRQNVTGRGEVIGQRYDEIKAEIEVANNPPPQEKTRPAILKLNITGNHKQNGEVMH